MAGTTVRAVVRWRSEEDTLFILVRRQGGGPWEEFQDPSLAAIVAGIADRADADKLLVERGIFLFDARTSAKPSSAADIDFLEFGDPEPDGFLAVSTDGAHVGRVCATPEELAVDLAVTRPVGLLKP